MALLTGVSSAVNSVLHQAVSDPTISRVVTYRRYTGQTAFNDELGYPEMQYASLSVRAACLTHTEESINASGLEGSVQAGQMVYLIKSSSLLVGGLMKKDFTKKDQIFDEGEYRKIIDIQWVLSFGVQITVEA